MKVVKTSHVAASILAFLVSGAHVFADISGGPLPSRDTFGQSLMLMIGGGLLVSAIVAITIIRLRNARQRKAEVRTEASR
ncbi:MAG: hypothetical protein U0996_00870 [Planctomycetaceae bacterium]